MLILTRRPMESLVIAENITVTILAINGNQVRLGIDAPKHIVVDRSEFHARKLRELTVHSVNLKASPHTSEPLR